MSRVALVLSDVDGTLVTHDKRLTEATIAAVRRMEQEGVGFTITSARPPFGLRMLSEPLGIRLPMGAFNGGCLIEPDGHVVEEHFIPEDAARETVELFEKWGVGIWVFANNQWYVTDPEGDYVEHEAHTVQTPATVVRDFDDLLARAGKIVGVSADFDHLAEAEIAAQGLLGDRATALRSQRYYLDIMPPGINKGVVVEMLSRHLGIPTDAILTIGDMDNDITMFRRSGRSVAMGNGSEAARLAAGSVTLPNSEDGFAAAINRMLDEQA